MSAIFYQSNFSVSCSSEITCFRGQGSSFDAIFIVEINILSSFYLLWRILLLILDYVGA